MSLVEISCVPVTREILKRDLAADHGPGIRSITTFAVYMDGDYFAQSGGPRTALKSNLFSACFRKLLGSYQDFFMISSLCPAPNIAFARRYPYNKNRSGIKSN